MNVLTFLAKNWDSVLVVVAFLALVVVLIKRGETKILKQILFNLVTQAEKQFGSGTGSLKYAAVADWIYQRIPAVLKLLFTSSDIEKMIEAALEEAKKAWGANENLKGYIDTPIRGKPACRHRRTGRPDRTRRKLNTSDSDKNESPSGVIPRRAFSVSYTDSYSFRPLYSFQRFQNVGPSSLASMRMSIANRASMTEVNHAPPGMI